MTFGNRHLVARRTARGRLLASLVAIMLGGGSWIAAAGNARTASRAAADTVCPASHWVGSWTASPSDAATGPYSDETLRMILTPHVGGSLLRVHLSNRFGVSPLTLAGTSIALRQSGASIVVGSSRRLTFGGRVSVTIPARHDVVSDPVSFRLKPFDDVAVSMFLEDSASSLTEHFTARQTSYTTSQGAGDRTRDPGSSAFSHATTARYLIDGIDVVASGNLGAVVTFGDSITDGVQGNPAGLDANGRYPDDLARRLLASRIPLTVLNAGISGNRINQNGLEPIFGPSGISRFNVDAVQQAGVTDVIILEGINDIGQTPATAAQVVTGLRNLVAQAHASGIPVQLGTLTPAGGRIIPSYGDASANAVREQVNHWIRTQHLSDGVIDFDAAVRDPHNPSRINPPYDGGDHLHFDLAGYKAMANAINLRRLRIPVCALPKLRLGLAPRNVVVGRQVAIRFSVTVSVRGHIHPLGGALILIAGHRIHTNAQGQASIKLRFQRTGSARVLATASGYAQVTGTVHITRPSP